MNNKQRLYHSNFNHNGFKKGKANKSRAHNLRAKETLDNLHMQKVGLGEICDPELIKNNLVFIDNKKVDPKDGDQFFEKITKDLENEKNEYLQKIKNAYDDSNKAEASDKRAKAKAALKRYSKSSENLEKDFWNDLVNRVGSEEIDSENEIQKLKNTTDTKIKSFNQKIKRLKELEKYNVLLGIKSRNTAFTVFSKEMVYKIPDDTDLNIKARDMAKFANKINKQLYPDFRPTYIAVHCDENPDRAHAHAELSGKNLKTGAMDIQDQLLINLQKQYELKNKDFSLKNRSYKALTFEEVQQFGQLYQDHIFEEMNQFLLKNGYDAKLEKRTKQEIKDDNRIFLDQKIPSQKREFTRAGKLKEQNYEANQQLQTTKIRVELNQKESFKLQRKNQALNEENKGVKEEIKEGNEILSAIYEQIGTAKEFFKNGMEAAYEYAMNSLPQALKTYMRKQEALDELDVNAGDKLHEKAVIIQKTQEQKKTIKASRIPPP